MPVTGRTVEQGGRAKAYRPLPAHARRAALAAFLAAYDRGDAFLAHELLEPAWMGTDDLSERYLYQGLIKLAASAVHAVRGNPVGEARNLAGARDRLARATQGRPPDAGLDLAVLLSTIDARQALLGAGAAPPVSPADAPLIRLPRSRGTPR